jgi:GGDEF domain-containing protein
MLVRLAAGLRNCIREIDHLFHSELDEFALVFPQTGEKGAEALLSRIRLKSIEQSLWGGTVEPSPSIAIGAATYPLANVETADALRALAQEMLAPQRK